MKKIKSPNFLVLQSQPVFRFYSVQNNSARAGRSVCGYERTVCVWL